MARDATAIHGRRKLPMAFGGSAVIGALGRLIGLGAAEFCLSLFIGLFRSAALEAVILNKATSLVVVASALPFWGNGALRTGRGPLAHRAQPARREPSGGGVGAGSGKIGPGAAGEAQRSPAESCQSTTSPLWRRQLQTLIY